MPSRAEPWPRRLLRWYDRNARHLPWRENPTPYRVWISEMMLQQTKVETVVPYFRRFVRTFPSVRMLAAANLAAVLKQWEGLGYYSRARNLHMAAGIICKEHGARLPRTYDELLKLPGIGPYCAAAIASIAFGERVPVVDGNVLRVFSRLWMINEDVKKTRTRQALFSRLQPYVPGRRAGDFNQAMMELGARVCTPRNPQCGRCPLRTTCAAHAANRIAAYPVRSPTTRLPHRHVDVGVVRRNGRILITQRPVNRMLGGLWVLPGGPRANGERGSTSVARCIREKTGLDVRPGPIVATVQHTYSHFSITMTAFECTDPTGCLPRKHKNSAKWVWPRALDSYPMPTATRRAISRWLEDNDGTTRKHTVPKSSANRRKS